MTLDDEASSVGVIILAAGASTRLGTPKQLLPFRGHTLIEHAGVVALASHCRPVVVVLGAFHTEIATHINAHELQVVVNERWRDGQGTSINAGIDALQKHSNIEAATLMLCDQPLITAEHLDELACTFVARKCAIVASLYAATLGVPALFSRSLWPELLKLEGPQGAKNIIAKHADQTLAVPFPDAAFDVDTISDVEVLKTKDCIAAPRTII
jgi:molybdenum cofactor cytidylyltransferase